MYLVVWDILGPAEQPIPRHLSVRARFITDNDVVPSRYISVVLCQQCSSDVPSHEEFNAVIDEALEISGMFEEDFSHNFLKMRAVMTTRWNWLLIHRSVRKRSILTQSSPIVKSLFKRSKTQFNDPKRPTRASKPFR